MGGCESPDSSIRPSQPTRAKGGQKAGAWEPTHPTCDLIFDPPPTREIFAISLSEQVRSPFRGGLAPL